MTKFLDKSFSSRPSTKAYRDNFERTFRRKAIKCKCPAYDRCGLTVTTGPFCDWCNKNCKEKP